MDKSFTAGCVALAIVAVGAILVAGLGVYVVTSAFRVALGG